MNHNEKVTKSVLSQSLFGWLVSKQVSELGCMDMISVRVRMSVVVTAVMVMLLIRTTAKMEGGGKLIGLRDYRHKCDAYGRHRRVIVWS